MAVIASLVYPAVVMYLLTTSEDSPALSPLCHERHRIPANQTASCVVGARTPTNIWDVARKSLGDIMGETRVQRTDELYVVHDLRLLWDETPNLEVVPSPQNTQNIASARMEQLVITTDAVRTGDGSPYGMLEPPTLLAAHNLQRAIEKRMYLNDVQCIQMNERCLVLSPLSFWPQADDVYNDWHPAKSYTGNPTRAIVTPPTGPSLENSSVPLLYSTTLASRWPYLPIFSRAEFLVMTFFLSDDQEVHEKWIQLVHEVAQEHNSSATRAYSVGRGETFLRVCMQVLTQFKPQHLTVRPTLNVSVVAGGYIMLLLFIFRGLVQMRRLHSRFGIAFTGSVQLLLDLIMSLSVCALLGIRLTAVPWSILPFIIVVVGSESMLFMIRTITNTPLTLTVHARIAYGLSQVFGPITLTALSDIVLLVLLASTIRIPAVLQFCSFAICTLIVDYFMQMTFFVTVLSIDMQRLELAEILFQAPNEPDAPVPEKKNTAFFDEPYRPRSAISYVVRGLGLVWHTRSARSLQMSFLATTVLTPVLYLASSDRISQFLAWLLSKPLPDDQNGLATLTQALKDNIYGPFWTSINPQNAPLVRILVEPWTLISLPQAYLPQDIHHQPGPWLERLFFYRQGATLFLIFLFVVFPISGTMLIMSIVLKYLRKDADLLEVQQEKSDGTDAGLSALLPRSKPDDTNKFCVNVEVQTDAMHLAPIHLVASCEDWVASVDICNSLRVVSEDYVNIQPLAAVRKSAHTQPDGSRILCMDLHRASSNSMYLCIGQDSGRLSVIRVPTWQLVLDVTQGPEERLTAVQQVFWAHGVMISMHHDGYYIAWPDLDRFELNHEEVPKGYVISSPATRSILWTTLAITGDANVYGGVSTEKDLSVVRFVQDHSAAATGNGKVGVSKETIAEVHAPDVCRCALLLPTEVDDVPESLAGINASNIKHLLPPKSNASTHRSWWLIAGDQNGALHLWLNMESKPTASLILKNSGGDGAIRRIQRVAGTSTAPLLLITTANWIWFVAVNALAPHLVLLNSLKNDRGIADILPSPSDQPMWVLGVRRILPTRPVSETARWELWRMRLPTMDNSATSSAFPVLEPLALPLEQLVVSSLDARLADASAEPPSRRPLLSARLQQMKRVDKMPAEWVVPFGSCLVNIISS
ncbi:hypothetical protein MYAM1_002585 [Malassezia yamatoensis]|uniref:SSD domain-containing protein n=1 Tax=Malassezia yamatoensis TaxID=253288 RepID=A0AAJ6CHF7_9BASI|nr:hypothetical protein MYAM1_002585 [Malassezia yamatoensis]